MSTSQKQAEDQLVSVTSASLTNGAIRVLNTYDYRHRRTSKIVQRLNSTIPPPPAPPTGMQEWETIETRTFAYDDWNLIHETIYAIEGSISNITEIQYLWGLDLSGTIQGAGGVGGLLAVSRNGQLYFPTFDNNGNVTKYIDESGNVAAAYEYDDFGRTISLSGPLSDFFRHRFSTKYYDSETGLYYYGYRFYSPDWRIWLNRDPIEEDGGNNLYVFCRNSPLFFFDDFGGEFRFAGDPGEYDGSYMALWGPRSGSFSVKWEYEGSDCCGKDTATKSYGPLFFNNTGDSYYPIWNVETIDEYVRLPQSNAIGTDLESGASPASGAWGDKRSLTITITWIPAQVPRKVHLNSPHNTEYWKHGAAWNLPNHFFWTDKPFSPFSNDGKIGTPVEGKETIVIVSSWNNCKGIKHNVKGQTISGTALQHGSKRPHKRR